MSAELLIPTSENLEKAAGLLRAGALVAFPTETVYGLGADAFDPEAAKKAYAAKGRPSDNPLIVHIADFDDIYKLVPESAVTDRVKKLADAFWPGPLTMVLPKLDAVPKETTGGLDTVAIRMPKSEATLEFIRKSGTCVSGPSANLSGHPSPTTWQHVVNDLALNIDAIICGDPCEGGIESTVMDVETLTIYRPGLITPEMISAVLGGEEVQYDEALFAAPTEPRGAYDKDFHPKAPGMKYKHYAPKADMCIYWGTDKQVETAIKSAKFAAKLRRRKVYVIKKIEPATFFAELRRADDEGADLILARALDTDDSISFSVMNRALKASGFNLIPLNR